MEVIYANSLLVENFYVLRANVSKTGRFEAFYRCHMRHFEGARVREEDRGDRFLHVFCTFVTFKLPAPAYCDSTPTTNEDQTSSCSLAMSASQAFQRTMSKASKVNVFSLATISAIRLNVPMRLL